MTLKLGKLPARKGAIKVKFSTYSSLPTPPKSVSHYKLVKDWQGMLGNDQYGDCVWAGGDHETILWNREAATTVSFTPAQALADYAAVTGFNPNNPNSDQGTDMQQAAAYRQKIGLIDAQGIRHKVGGYAEIAAGDITELKQAVALFGAVGIGIEFPSTAMDQFNAGKAWTVVRGASIEGGHYVPVVGYNSTYLYVITWGKLQKVSWAFFKRYCDEAIVYISSEMLSNNVSIDGYNLAQLQADIQSFTN